MKLAFRFFLILLACSLVPVLITGVWLLRFQTAARENARQLHLQMTQLAAETVESFAADVNRALGFAAELERIGLAASLGSPSLKGRRSPLPEGIGTTQSTAPIVLEGARPSSLVELH